MGLKRQYIDQFFRTFKMNGENIKGSDYGYCLKEAIIQFLESSSKKTAMDVYVSFFDSYKIMQGNTNFVDLLDVLKNYEENAATLIDKQRDHFVHSVNVFLLGLGIYSQNNLFREIIKKEFEKSPKYQGKSDSPIGEFFFQWGIAALCHDIGYPVEIVNGQIRKFIKLISDVEGKNVSANPYLAFWTFDVLNSIPTRFRRKMEFDGKEMIIDNLLDLLSYDVSRKLGTIPSTTKEYLDNFLSYMQKLGIVDHGFYSSLIVLKWYSYMVEINNLNPEFLYNPILNVASAILLHNYYRNVLKKNPFGLGALAPDKHPIAYLLILCDELQEWNREAYGMVDKHNVAADESRLEITSNLLKIAYLAPKGSLDKDFSIKKEEYLKSLLDIKGVFSEEIKISTLASTDLFVELIQKQDEEVSPRLLLRNIEKIAREIHNDYNKKQAERNPNAELEYPSWDALPESLKYSNIRQARDITEKLKGLGYSISETGRGNEITELTPDQVEMLAIKEHQSWVKEREDNGWKYGKVRDVEKKISPYLVPYEDLSEDIKELDRDAVRNMIPLLNKINLRIFKPSRWRISHGQT